MTDIAHYEHSDRISTISLDDGKANVISPTMTAAINRALDRAEVDGTVVIITGRRRIFSAGFDLEILGRLDDETVGMLRGGFELVARLLAFPAPVVIACTGHALAMGSFLMCAADYRVGADGDYKIGANEVAIGLPMPLPALSILQHRLAPNLHTRSIALAEIFTPAAACGVGFLDHVVAPERVLEEARTVAERLATLDRKAYLATKSRMRSVTIDEIRAGIDADYPVRG